MKFTWRHMHELRSVLAEEKSRIAELEAEIVRLQGQRNAARAELARCRGSLGAR